MGKSKELATGAAYVDASGDTMTGALNVTGVARNTDGLLIGASNAATGYGLRIGASGATDPLEIWREHSNGNQMQLSVDYHGRVTMPYQPSMFITGNWNTYQPADSSGRVRFNYVKAGYNDGFNTSTHTFTAPAAGKYLMNVYALIQTGTNWEFQFHKNGSLYARCYTQGDRTTSGHVIMDMAANDYASIVCQTSIYLHQTDSYSGWTITKVA